MPPTGLFMHQALAEKMGHLVGLGHYRDQGRKRELRRGRSAGLARFHAREGCRQAQRRPLEGPVMLDVHQKFHTREGNLNFRPQPTTPFVTTALHPAKSFAGTTGNGKFRHHAGI